MKPDPNRAASPSWGAAVSRSVGARGDTVVGVIDDRRLPQPNVEFRVEPRRKAILIGSIAIVAAVFVVAASVQDSNWWVKGAAIAIMGVLVAFVARAMFSSVVVSNDGIRAKNAFGREVTATWDQIREFRIDSTRTVQYCQVTLADGTRVKIHAFKWPGGLAVLNDVIRWLGEYDSPLRLHNQRLGRHTFRNDRLR